MPIKRSPQLTAWSYSRLQTFKTCPLKLKLGAIDRIREPEGPALVKGKAVETEALDYIFGKGRLPESCARFPEEMAQLRKIHSRVRAKLKVAFDSKWRVLCIFEGREGAEIPRAYFDAGVWLRMEFDLVWEEKLKPGHGYRLRIVDLKTGKIYEDKLDQLMLYLVTAFLLPEDVITHAPLHGLGEMYYLDQGETREKSLVLTDMAAEKARWEEDAGRLLRETAWEPTPSGACRFCYYRKANKKNGGGQCPY
jgi:RecB family exonuclease